MQDCFREHPDIYGAELADDDDEEETQLDRDVASAARSNESKTDSSTDAREPAASPKSPGEPSKSVAKPSAETSKSAVDSSSQTSAPAPNPETGDGEKVGDKKSAPGSTKRAQQAKAQVQTDHGDAKSESDEVVPKAWHDATGEGIKTEK